MDRKPKQFQAGFNFTDTRRRHNKNGVEMRNKKRADHTMKRRQVLSEAGLNENLMKLLDTDETNTKRLLDVAIEKILWADMETIFQYIQAGQVLVRREHIIPGALEEARRVVSRLFECILHFTDES